MVATAAPKTRRSGTVKSVRSKPDLTSKEEVLDDKPVTCCAKLLQLPRRLSLDKWR